MVFRRGAEPASLPLGRDVQGRGVGGGRPRCDVFRRPLPKMLASRSRDAGMLMQKDASPYCASCARISAAILPGIGKFFHPKVGNTVEKRKRVISLSVIPQEISVADNDILTYDLQLGSLSIFLFFRSP